MHAFTFMHLACSPNGSTPLILSLSLTFPSWFPSSLPPSFTSSYISSLRLSLSTFPHYFQQLACVFLYLRSFVFFSFSSNNPLPASHSLSFSLCIPSSFPSLPLRHVSVLSTCSFPYSLLSRPSTISLLSEPPFVSPTFLSVDLLLGSDKQALIPCQRSIKNTQPSKQ